MAVSCHQCQQKIIGQPYYYYRDSRQQEADKIPFCSTLCIQEWKGKGGHYRHYNIVNLDEILRQRRRNQDLDDGDIRT